MGLRTKVNKLLLSKSSRGRGQGYALWKTEVQPGAYRFNIRYQKGPKVKATIILVRFPKDPKANVEGVATFSVSASPETIAEAIIREVVRQVEGAEVGRPTP